MDTGFFGLNLNTAAAVAAMAAAALVAPAAYGQVFANATPITIPDFGPATPFGSAVNVAGVSDAGGIRIRLKGFSHTFCADVAVLLVAPSGVGIELLSGSGGAAGVSGLTLTFAGESTQPVPGPLATGTYAPAGGSFGFAAPAAAIPRASDLGELVGGGVNGQWRLFVQDFANGDSGSIAEGWEVEFGPFGFPPTPLSSTAFTYQGRLQGVAPDGPADLRFTLWDHPTSPTLVNQVFGPVSDRTVQLIGGAFTTTVDFGLPLPRDRAVWLQVEAGAAGSGVFTTLRPRQRLTPAPLAATAFGLGQRTEVPPIATISGPQVEQADLTGASLTIAAAGQPFFSEIGATGGELRLRGGSHNKADPSPTLGLSNGGDVAIFAGRNFWDAGWHGNIRFHAGFGEPERVRIVGDTGDVGIGTTTPVAKLDVRGSVALGNNGQLRAAAGEVDLRLMYGNVNAGGGIINGTGFAVTNTGTGAYTITFATPFSGPPALTANAVANSSLTVMVTSIAPNAATIQIRNGISVLTSANFTFTAIGPR